MTRSINPAERLHWLRCLRRFKYGMKARAKLGVLDAICQQVAVSRRGQTTWSAPDWDDDKWIAFLYTCIRDNQYPTKILTAFAQSAEVTFFNSKRQPTVSEVIQAVDEICKQLSIPLRNKFGVFGEQHDMAIPPA